MEYHGMGTRSWASMLTVKAFIEGSANKHEENLDPFFPILAAEEPEAHLHPNAQKTLYQQLEEVKGQVIVSTHSPYIATMANISDIRALKKTSNGVESNSIIGKVSNADKKILDRMILSLHGEILFSKALILCEGVSEKQLFPVMFEQYIGKTLFSLGITCLSVGGTNFKQFVRLSCGLGIPTFFVSDNDKNGVTKKNVENYIKKLKITMQHQLNDDILGVSFLTEGNDLEAELLLCLNLKSEIIESLVLSTVKDSENKRNFNAKRKQIEKLTDDKLLQLMRQNKSSYSGFLAEILLEKELSSEIIPAAVMAAINQIKEWCLL